MLYGRYAKLQAEKRTRPAPRRKTPLIVKVGGTLGFVFCACLLWSHRVLDTHLSQDFGKFGEETGTITSDSRNDEERSALIKRQKMANHRQDLPGFIAPPDGIPKVFHNATRTLENRSTALGRFILFEHIPFGQGAGNQIQGLLGAHLLGMEFNRTVCVTPEYKSFVKAFEPIASDSESHCDQAFREAAQYPDRAAEVKVYTWWGDVNECMLKQLMLSDVQFVRLSTNFYPGWPEVEDDWFKKLYKPTKALLRWIPWKGGSPPHTVVHLRHGDSSKDVRKGLDNKTFELLGRMLDGDDVYLVTNNVDWYAHFNANFGWKHPPWVQVPHSACFWVEWGGANLTKKDKPKPWQSNLQLWSDWWTILNGKRVLHTHSDFSLSAIHFVNNKNTSTIEGVNETTNSLILLKESWIRDGTMTPLSVRQELKYCDKKDLQDGGELLIAKRYQERQKAKLQKKTTIASK